MTAMAGRKKVFSLHGNCQAEALAGVLLSNPEFFARFEYAHVPPVFSIKTDELDTFYKDTLPRLDLLLYMPIAATYRGKRLSSAHVLSRLPPSAEVLSFTNCYFRGYHPELVHLDGVPSRTFVGFYDLNILAAYLSGERDPRRVADAIDRDDLLDPGFLAGLAESSLAHLSQRERHGDERGPISLTCADYIAENYRDRQLFHTVNHPAREVLCHLADQAYRLLGIPGTADRSWPEPLALQRFPLHRGVRRALGLTFEGPADYHLGDRRWSPPEAVAAFLDHYASLPRDVLVRGYEAERWPLTFAQPDAVGACG